MKNFHLNKTLSMLDPTKQVVIRVVDQDGNKPTDNYRIIALNTDGADNAIVLNVSTIK